VIHAPALAFAVQVVRGGATLVVDVLAITALQRAVASDQLARVFGVFFAMVIGAIALGTVVTPVIVGALGLDAGLWIMALGPVPIALAGSPALRRTDLQSASRASELEPRVALLESLGLFAGASRPVLERLAAAAITETYAPATAIVREGDPADALYVLADGEVQVSAHGESGGTEQPIEVLMSPAFFGEIGLLEAIARTATVTALSECRCERIAGEAFLEALTTSPPSTALMETARGRLAVTLPSRRIAYATTSGTG
jgi:CRP-like cAMP-binding protein